METEYKNLLEQRKVEEAITNLFIHTDNREWDKVRSCFDHKVLFDMSSMTGMPPTVFDAEKIMNEWENGLKNLKSVHHQAGNYLTTIKGNEALVFCYGIAFHYLPDTTGQDIRTFVGSYNFRLFKVGTDWKINVFKYNSKFITGNLTLGQQSGGS
jgi:hypothetical protein